MGTLKRWGMELVFIMFVVSLLAISVYNTKYTTVISFCDHESKMEFRITHNGSSANIPELIPFSKSGFCSE